MLRVIRSTVHGLDIDTELEDDFADAVEAGKLLRETYSEDKHGQKSLSIEVRAYTSPEGQNRFAVLWTDDAEVDWRDTDSYPEARTAYEEMVRETEKGADIEVDEDGNEKPLFTATDVPGVGDYEDGAEEAGAPRRLCWSPSGPPWQRRKPSGSPRRRRRPGRLPTPLPSTRSVVAATPFWPAVSGKASLQ